MWLHNNYEDFRKQRLTNELFIQWIIINIKSTWRLVIIKISFCEIGIFNRFLTYTVYIIHRSEWPNLTRRSRPILTWRRIMESKVRSSDISLMCSFSVLHVCGLRANKRHQNEKSIRTSVSGLSLIMLRESMLRELNHAARILGPDIDPYIDVFENLESRSSVLQVKSSNNGSFCITHMLWSKIRRIIYSTLTLALNFIFKPQWDFIIECLIIL